MLPCDLCLPQAHKKGIGENRTPKGRFNGCFVPWNLKCNQHDSTVYPSLSSNCLEWKTIGLTSLSNLVFQNCINFDFGCPRKAKEATTCSFLGNMTFCFYMCKPSNLGGHHGSPGSCASAPGSHQPWEAAQAAAGAAEFRISNMGNMWIRHDLTIGILGFTDQTWSNSQMNYDIYIYIGV